MEKEKQSSLWAKIGNRIFIGLLIVTPLVATFWIIQFALNLATSWFPADLWPRLAGCCNGYALKIVVLFMMLAALFLLGAISRFFFGKWLWRLLDRILSRIPFVKQIYVFFNKICGIFADDKSKMFSAVGMVEYPRKGSYSICFITSDTSASLTRALPEGSAYTNVFIPTTPNPTSGFYLIYPTQDVKIVDIPVADAINLIMSAGAMTASADSKEDLLSLLDRRRV